MQSATNNHNNNKMYGLVTKRVNGAFYIYLYNGVYYLLLNVNR